MRKLFVCLLLVHSSPALAASAATRSMNPDISANLLGLAQHGTALSDSPTAIPRNGLRLQEAELHFSSDVDPYLRALAIFAIHQESGSAGYKIDPEEAFLETISLPRIQLKAGKIKAAFGRHNQLHSHAFPFIDAPMIHQRVFGEEGLNELGVSVSGLLPAPWFSELTLQAISLRNDALLNHYGSGELGAVGRWKNLLELSDASTLELGVSGVKGKNSKHRRNSSVIGADLTWKWRPTAGGEGRSLSWSTEYLYAQREGFTRSRDLVDPVSGATFTVEDSIARLGGVSTWLQFQFSRRWWLQGRYEYFGLQQSPALNSGSKESALLAFNPSEFSSIRLQHDWIQDSARPRRDRAIAVQYNVSIGAHPAHEY